MKFMKLTACAACTAIALSGFTGCKKEDPLQGAVVGENSFVMTLYPDIAPETCENFQKLVDEGFYNGLTFHRIVDEFVAQGGDPNGDGTGGSDKTITGEFSANGVDNNLSHVRGTVSMARADDYNSATCQFFICYDNITYLDGQYAAFGSVTEGMEVVDGFLNVPRSVGRMGEVSVPETPVYIKAAASVEADAAGNPRVQFLIEYDKTYKSTATTAATTASTVPETTAVSGSTDISGTDISAVSDMTGTGTVSTDVSESDAGLS